MLHALRAEQRDHFMSADLLPAEKIALTVAFAQVLRGEPPMPNTATVCVLALARLAGSYDWTKTQEPKT